MENEHELSYETLTRVYLGSYEYYKSLGVEAEPLEHGFEFDDQEWVEIKTLSFDLFGSSLSKGLLLLRVIEEEVGDELATSMEDVEGCLWCRGLYKEEERDVAILKTKRWIVGMMLSTMWTRHGLLDLRSLSASDDDLKKDSNDVIEAGEEIDDDIHKPDTEETQTRHSTEHTTEEPLSIEHQSPSPTKDVLESSKKADDLESSSCYKTLKPYGNYIPITKRKLHEEVAVSYADLKATIEGYYEENVDHKDQIDKLVKETMNNLDKISKARADERAKLLKTLNRVSETLEADSALKEAIKKMVESNNTTSQVSLSCSGMHKCQRSSTN
uniref:Uncharacterized protein n=1 Tax=Tanacetum cinerariifolium TaxID=118510 RepID=A0A699GPY1_TANCI|nr:hypothetical protein [Tanacetum cinerariifolium]